MKPAKSSPKRLAKEFNTNVKALDAQSRKFLESSDPSNNQALRKATRRLWTAYSLLPKDLRNERTAKRYLRASRALSRATGKVRDLDTMGAWTSRVGDAKDRRSLASDLQKTRASAVRATRRAAGELTETRQPSIERKDLDRSDIEGRMEKVERRLAKKVDKEFEGFLSTQESDIMHALRKDSKGLRHVLALCGNGDADLLSTRLRSIQDELGAIRDHDLIIDYLSSRGRLTSTRALIREEIAKRHARLEDFVSKNRGQGHVVRVPAKKAHV